MLNIYLARHGQDEDNAHKVLNGHRDRPLTELGISQAKQAAENIFASEIRFDHIYASPLQRAYKTAELIATRLGMPQPEVWDDLIERDFGVMTGKPQSEIVALCAPDILQAEKVTYFLSPDGAETFPDLLVRAARVIKICKDKHPDGNILLVTHGDFGKMLYAHHYNLEWRTVLKLFHFGNSELLLLDPKKRPEATHVFQIEQHNL